AIRAKAAGIKCRPCDCTGIVSISEFSTTDLSLWRYDDRRRKEQEHAAGRTACWPEIVPQVYRAQDLSLADDLLEPRPVPLVVWTCATWHLARVHGCRSLLSTQPRMQKGYAHSRARVGELAHTGGKILRSWKK